MKTISADFFNDLKNTEGLLHPILDRVQQDNTLMLAIRNQYINIYYRGGNILRVKQGKGDYSTFFDDQYNKSGVPITSLPSAIKSQNDAHEWVKEFPRLKEIMDLYFSNKSKPEREFQQLVARENNDSTISNESEYFIADIEFADSSLAARFDMLAIRWLASQRKNGTNCRAALIEMKYGDKALDGTAGLLKHVQDIDALISDKEKYLTLLEMMEDKFNLLEGLELLNFNRSKSGTKVKLDNDTKPEVIFIIANHNPRSPKLKTILSDPEFDVYGQSQRFDLRFFAASFSGYGLHADCMHPLVEFRKWL